MPFSYADIDLRPGLLDRKQAQRRSLGLREPTFYREWAETIGGRPIGWYPGAPRNFTIMPGPRGRTRIVGNLTNPAVQVVHEERAPRRFAAMSTRYNGTVSRVPLRKMSADQLKAIAAAVDQSRRLSVPAPDARELREAREVAQRIMVRRRAKQEGRYLA